MGWTSLIVVVESSVESGVAPSVLPTVVPVVVGQVPLWAFQRTP